MPNTVATDYHESKLDSQNPVAAAGGLSASYHKRVRKLEREDIIIIILSAVLVIATLVLAAKVL